MKSRIFLFSIILCIASALQAQETPKKQTGDKFELAPTGRFYVDLAKYFKDKEPLSNGVAFGDIRLGMKATYNQWKGEIVFGFANSKLSFKDIFIQYNMKDKKSHFKLGHFVEPFGIEYIDGSVGNKFVTSSSASQAFGGKRHLGVQYTSYSDKFWYSGGVFADNNVAKGAEEGSQGFAAAGRFVFNPLREEGKIFHIGLAGELRKADAAGIGTDEDGNSYQKIRSVGYSSGTGTVVEKRKFINAKIGDAKNQQRFGAEFIGAIGRVYAQGEYFQAHVKREHDLTSYNARGFYSQMGVLAIGKPYRYDKGLSRMLRAQPGELEFLVRYGWTNLNDADSGIFGGKQSDITCAVNYCYSKFLHVRLNYTNVKLDKHSIIGEQRFSAISARLMLLF